MANTRREKQVKRDVLAAASAVPSGFVTSFDAIGALLDVMPRHVAHILQNLDPGDYDRIPWHRVVHKDGRLSTASCEILATQRTRLAEDGVTCDDAGRVDKFLDRLTQVMVLTRQELPPPPRA